MRSLALTHPTLTPTFFKNGVWHGFLQAPTKPVIEVRYLGQVLDEISVKTAEDGWELSVHIPPAAISDGVHCFVIFDAVAARELGSFTIIAGAPADEDLRSEIALLRAELDMLKRAFRRSQTPSD